MALLLQTAPLAAVLLITVAAFAGGPAHADAKTPARAYKVDSVIATAKGRTITIQAKGAVQSGGWTNARLHLLHNDGRTLTMELVAVPPPPEMTVIDALVPLKASAEVRTQHAAAMTAVRVQAEVNEVTTQVLH